MVMPATTAACQPAVPDDAAQGQRGDDLHGGQEQRAQPGGAVSRLVHLAGQHAEFLQVLLLAHQGLDHAHAGDVLVVRAGDLRVDLAHVAELLEDALAELVGHVDQDRQHDQHDQGQLPVEVEHEDHRGEDADDRPGQVEQAPGDQVGDALRVGGDARHDPAHRGAAVVGEREVLQMVEHLLAQIVADPFAQHADRDR